ncbi:Stk1 family PASTA domain-containing Ser/Thr kinase [Nicoliella spurrieriana]|uniref:non-specific serine/threonine protein kinase n=1 Tax=Nicoliella spurrieriana TaxID=2925830 RepID=A0A976X5F1_9LACO|nr:Stk1 family PASTA domain-containing Ser/Thr kinase [Nicoliella spurrieriana]UQS86641.1 Stk1 family PASTA domain-containing Ser/Thr kinase [Nicoliella spurrieriana]
MVSGRLLNHRYRLIEQIGQGGMSDVYLAKDIKTNRLVAVKFLRVDFRDDPKIKAQFRREALAISQLSSANIVKVYGFEETDGVQYSIMEYVRGMNLKNYIHNYSPIAVSNVLKIMNQILLAVNVAHQNNIVHRDLKPENVLIDENENVKITDFGIAIFTTERTLTQTHSIIGSIHYLSPEQVRGEGATKRSDIYSLGIIMYELLTGKVPFDGDNPVSIALKHSKSPLPPINATNQAIPLAVENVVLRATAKNPNDRFASIAEMQTALNQALNLKHVQRFVPKMGFDDEDETKIMNFNELNALDNTASGTTTSAPSKRGIHHPARLFWSTWVGVVGIILVTFGLVIHFYFAQVPSLTGLSKQQAIQRLHSAGLKVKSIQYRYANNVPIGHAFSSIPQTNRWVLRSNPVTLVLSNGVDKISLDNYIGQDFEQTAKELSDRGFKIEKQLASSDTFGSGKILKQNFIPGNSYSPHNKKIKFVVSDGIKQFTLKRLVGMTKDEAASYVQMMGLNPTFDYQYNDEYPAGMVFNQNPDSGLTVFNGDNVIISVSKGAKTSGSQNGPHTLNVNVNLPYQSDDHQSNEIDIYVKDANNSLSHLYRRITIYQNTKFIIPFKLDGKTPGEYKIVRDGKTINYVKNIN